MALDWFSYRTMVISPLCAASILDAAHTGLITIVRYENQSRAMLAWIRKTIQDQYDGAENQPEYRHFLQNKFDFLRHT